MTAVQHTQPTGMPTPSVAPLAKIAPKEQEHSSLAVDKTGKLVGAATLKNTTALNPVPMTAAQREKAKTAQEKAEDIIYTLNHSITCLSITDAFLQSAIVNWVNRYLNTNIAGHEHNHGYNALEWAKDQILGKHNDPVYVAQKTHEEIHRIAHDIEHNKRHLLAGKTPHPDPAPKLTPDDKFGKAAGKFLHTSGQWLLAEAVGDLGAVPFTIAVQRHAPGFMQSLRKGIEATLGGLYRWRTTGAAKTWGEKHGFAPDSQEVKDRQHELYEYEISHMPQMAVWTASSVALNFGAMHAFHHMNPRRFEKTSLLEFFQVKGIGAAMTAILVVGVRGLTPGGAHWWDRTMGKHVVMPIARIFGIGEAEVKAFEAKREMIETGANHLQKAGDISAAETDIAMPKVAHSVPATKVKAGMAKDEIISVERLQHAPEAAQAVGSA